MRKLTDQIPDTLEELIEYADYLTNNHVDRSSEDMIEITLRILRQFEKLGKENQYECAQCKFALANYYYDINDVPSTLRLLDDIVNSVKSDADTLLVIVQSCHLKAQCLLTCGQTEEGYLQLKQELQIMSEMHDSVPDMVSEILYDFLYEALIKLAAIDSLYHKDFKQAVDYETAALQILLKREHIPFEDISGHVNDLSKDSLIKLQSNLTDIMTGYTRLKQWEDALKYADLTIQLLFLAGMEHSQKAFRMKFNRLVVWILSGDLETAKEHGALLQEECEKYLGKYNILTIRINRLIEADYRINPDTLQLDMEFEQEQEEQLSEEDPQYSLFTQDQLKEIFRNYKKLHRGVMNFSDGTIINEELLIAIDYTRLNDFKNIAGALRNIIIASDQYGQSEFMYLWLRELIIPSYKPEYNTLIDLKNIVSSYADWMTYLRGIADEWKSRSEDFSYVMPFWLENERRLLCDHMHEEYDVELVRHIPCCLVKSNMIYARSKTIGKTKIILIDSGLYFYLFEWTKAIYNGKWVRDYMVMNPVYEITEPIKTVSNFMTRVVCALEHQDSIYKIPIGGVCMGMPTALRLRDAVKWMLSFIVGHEYGHILLNQSKPANQTEAFANEYAADELAINWINGIQDETAAQGMNGKEASVKASINEKLDYIDILFLFYDMYNFFSKKVAGVLGKTSALESVTHPSAKNRMKRLRRYANSLYDKSLSNYANEFCEQVVDYINKMGEEKYIEIFMNPM